MTDDTRENLERFLKDVVVIGDGKCNVFSGIEAERLVDLLDARIGAIVKRRVVMHLAKEPGIEVITFLDDDITHVELGPVGPAGPLAEVTGANGPSGPSDMQQHKIVLGGVEVDADNVPDVEITQIKGGVVVTLKEPKTSEEVVVYPFSPIGMRRIIENVVTTSDEYIAAEFFRADGKVILGFGGGGGLNTQAEFDVDPGERVGLKFFPVKGSTSTIRIMYKLAADAVPSEWEVICNRMGDALGKREGESHLDAARRVAVEIKRLNEKFTQAVADVREEAFGQFKSTSETLKVRGGESLLDAAKRVVGERDRLRGAGASTSLDLGLAYVALDWMKSDDRSHGALGRALMAHLQRHRDEVLVMFAPLPPE